jgi:hypothetical protein
VRRSCTTPASAVDQRRCRVGRARGDHRRARRCRGARRRTPRIAVGAIGAAGGMDPEPTGRPRAQRPRGRSPLR